MNDNLVLVRAIDIEFLPNDNIIKPKSNIPNLSKEPTSAISNVITRLLIEKNILKPYDFSRYDDEVYIYEYKKNLSEVVSRYIPYISEYNTGSLFSINGLCPDDSEKGFGNNTFSNKDCAIIEPLKYHIDSAISLHPTDTLLQGDIIMSNEALVLINVKKKEEFLQGEYLKNISSDNIIFFQGSLKDAVEETIKNRTRYNPEELTLSRNNEGIKLSDTSTILLKEIHELREKNSLSYMKYFDIYTMVACGRIYTEDLPKYENIKDEHKNYMKIKKVYYDAFFSELSKNFVNCNINVDLATSENYLINYIKDIFDTYGIEAYLDFVKVYNDKLLLELNNNILENTSTTLNKIQENNLKHR